MMGQTEWQDWCRSSGMQGERAAITRETTRVTATVGRRWLHELAALTRTPGSWLGTRYAVRQLARRLVPRTDPAGAAEWAFWDAAGETMDAIAQTVAVTDPAARLGQLIAQVSRVVETAERDLAVSESR